MSKQAEAYSRVSTGRQATEGQSLEVQEQAIQAYCKSRGFILPPSIHTDAGISGRSRKGRPGLERALDAVCSHGGVLVVTSLSRLARSTVDACNILERLHGSGGDLAVIDIAADTTTAQGKLIFGIMSSIAEFESNLISERIKASKQHLIRKRKCRTDGIPTAGYRVVGDHLEQVPEEQKVIRLVRHLRSKSSGAWVARELNRRGVPTIAQLRNNGKGAPWSRQSVHALLNAPPAYTWSLPKDDEQQATA